MRIQVVINTSGKVIAAVHVSTTADTSKEQAGCIPLVGQRVVELDVPLALQAMDPQSRLRAVLEHCVNAEGTHLEPLTQK